MKYWLLFMLIPFSVMSQPICNPSGNLMIFSNYDGGRLNIDVDVNIPNLHIGILSYESVEVNLSGTFLNNVVAVHYVGYNGSNNNCGPTIPTSVINNLPSGATSQISFAPSVTLSNTNGNNSMICAYTCDNNTYQGGCNTVDQVEHFFLTQFPGTSLYAHMVQYSCWSGTWMLSGGGNCCPAAPIISVSATGTDANCNGACDGTATATTSGGTSPFTYLWDNGATTQSVTGLCAGNFSVTVTDGTGATATDVITISEPTAMTGFITTTPDPGTCVGTATVNVNGGSGIYTYLWSASAAGQTSPTATGLCPGQHCVTITDGNNCTLNLCENVSSSLNITETDGLFATIYPNPTFGKFYLTGISPNAAQIQIKITDITGRLIHSCQSIRSSGKFEQEFNLREKGLYLVTIESGQQSLKLRLLVE